MDLTTANLPAAPLGWPVPMFGALDTFWIFVAIALATWIYNLIQKKAEEQPGSSGDEERPTFPPASPPRSGVPPSAKSWEEEIRRLLGEEPPPSPPPLPRPAPSSAPPVIVARPGPVAAPRPVVHKPKPPAPARSPQPVIVEPEDRPATLLAKFDQSRAAYKKASRLHESVAERLRRIDQQTEQHQKSAVPQRRPGSSEATAAVALVRSPRTVRQAVVASLILGPPKSLSTD
jgi:type IV secretory pathway VirB10-like protein